jgi:hypothetical protein
MRSGDLGACSGPMNVQQQYGNPRLSNVSPSAMEWTYSNVFFPYVLASHRAALSWLGKMDIHT